jgi:hypothetical protein
MRTGFIWLRIGTSCCEHGYEPSGSMKWCVFLEWLSNWRLLEKDSAALSSFARIQMHPHKTNNFTRIFCVEYFITLTVANYISSNCRTMKCKGFENRSGLGLIWGSLFRGTGENHKKNARIVGVPAENRAYHLPNTRQSRERLRLSCLIVTYSKCD